MQFVGLFVLIVLACLFLNSIQGCNRGRGLETTCYVISRPQTTAEYVCPICGQKTLYDNDDAAWVVQSMETCRREYDLLVQISPLKMKLDESSFCAKCSPNANEHQLALTVTHEDGTNQTTSPVSWNDLRILRDYFQGRLTSSAPGKTPAMVREETIRVKYILGREVPVPPQKQ
jgi:hypothetical protein